MGKSKNHNWIVDPPQTFKKIPANKTIIEDESLIGQTFRCSMRKRREKFTIKRIFKDNKNILCVEATDPDKGGLYTFPADACKLDKARYKPKRKKRKRKRKKLE